MSSKIEVFDKFKLNKPNWWLFFAIIIGLFLLLFLVRSCNSGPNEYWSGNQNSRIIIPPQKGKILNPPFPDWPNRFRPIDSTKIVVPDDPLKRPVISNLLNVYVKDSTNLKNFSSNVIQKYFKDSLEVTYYAEEYKRVQFLVPEGKREFLKKEIKSQFIDVKFVCYESIIKNNNLDSDPGYSNSDLTWFYEQIGLFKAWTITEGDPEIRIAIIDDSFDGAHPELREQIVTPWNVVEYSNNINSYYGSLFHGTHVAGTAAGQKDNGYGISGVAPKCKIIPVQIADSQGRMTTSSILDGIFYALKNDASVINLSLGINTSQIGENLTKEEQKRFVDEFYVDEAEMWNEVFEIARNEGTIIVQAAGNSSLIAELDPMKRSEICLVVGATNRDLQKANFSNYGNSIDVYAPGVEIYSSVPDHKFKKLDGTSMASPIISGCVALMMSKDKSITLEEIKKMIDSTGLEVKNEKSKFIQIDKILAKL